MLPLSFSLDNAGPLARSARDCARLLSAVAGHDPLDPTSSTRPAEDYEARLDEPLRGRRIAVPKRHYHERCSAEVRAALTRTLALFEREGASLVELEVPDPQPLDALGNILILSEAAALHAPLLRARAADYTPLVRSRIEFGFAFSAQQYLDALAQRAPSLARFVEIVFSRADALHLPMLSEAVPSMASVDAGLAGQADLSFNLAANTRSINYLGLPSIALPCGFSANGLPIAFQLVGAPFSEALLLGLGHQFEQAAGAAPLPTIQ
jgi:aspartyl-tRNA(Asn)/glutamyl-tRNA(Gln) amidotransferase subunit A